MNKKKQIQFKNNQMNMKTKNITINLVNVKLYLDVQCLIYKDH